MENNPKVLGIITARGGSKGIPRKNIKPLCGRPMICYMIDATLNSKLLTRCVVSTDDDEIAEIAREAGAEVPFKRPAELAQDDTRDMPVLQHAINWIKDNDGQEFDAIMMIHPTSPLCLGEDIDACIEKMIETDADSVMSMVEVTDFNIKKLKAIRDGQIESLFAEEGREPIPRTAGPKVYKRNAALYLTKTPLIMSGDMIGERSFAHIMPLERSVDVNTTIDFDIAELQLEKLKTKTPVS
ncbi:MAG: acylneuraminate cytidylyltransferase family protein [Candidatus Peribacteraceae bacterium]|jgi:CMP-N-acetylneuraminic acid synthetase|nr:acylneuraminate cytidylyltransferase family protein [Candidatus Peribacteraceae bacterium]MDP7454436.1 acylneuraminate cytidylyltransferase family protein [Candidatus Peribacteraceae bacterium]MDP7645805.1 acylneuraminate cytidylyltransferase family protein [Candidatus Peribacteraceae bacterium]